MAENVSWILTHHPPGSRVVLWAHNSHVSHNQQYMGGHLAMKYRDYRAIGFATQTGSYTARGCRGLGAYPLLTAPPDTIEQTVFSVVPQREFILDLRAAGHLWSSGRWLLDPHPFRNIGAAAMPECADEASLASRSRQQIGEGGAKYGFYPIPLARWFDAVVFIARTTPSHVFPRMRASGAGTSTPCR
jgi:erythromycin esterase-like protein